MVAARLVASLAVASATATAMKFDMATMMKIKAFESRFTQDNILQEQKVALMENTALTICNFLCQNRLTRPSLKNL